MLKIDISLGALAGAVANGSDADRWFVEIDKGRLFLVSADFQSDEEIERVVEMIKANAENYLPLPFLSHEEFLDEVDMYIRTLSDKPELAKHLEEAVKDKATKDEIMQLLNHHPGQKKEFADFYSGRVQERVAVWLDNQGIKVTG